MIFKNCNIERIKEDILVTALIDNIKAKEEIVCLIFKDEDILFKCVDNTGRILALKFKDSSDGIEYICQRVPDFKRKYIA